jgi:lantibiotic modifying enzyme
MGGAAGFLLAVLSLQSASTLAVAKTCGEHLLRRARPTQGGLGWEILGTRPLTGFSHGAAGIASALLELFSRTEDPRYRETALGAFAFERATFDTAAGDWPDLRGDPVAKKWHVAWCTGAPGIGLGRLRALDLTASEIVAEDIERALEVTVARGLGRDHSLCHGDLGSLEFLRAASTRPRFSAWSERVDRLTAGVLDTIDERGWVSGVPSGLETPGLMTGIAGIGWGCLRLAEPSRSPSVLVL